ncbi:TPA: CpsD/CapB family tyrosine-protein kinase [Streptococcus suis]|nr:CpsD/CapB family tyrosine-protein kinase [Streptococcus sp. 29896]WNY47884.1 CpsD/CapB family tyrosine-protein kinase [Streptococcus sp. 29896]HEL1586676.1 CpsD/CapB family tyrosine-protein kinase [Streptococcus suis]HEL2056971.1 CpsD/CapB family tyrosine-protein kinase [Streptococcus suis]
MFKKQKRLRTQSKQRAGAPLFTYMQPFSLNSEQIRVLRTNLEYARVNGNLKSLLVTSSIPAEGKSTTAANLAYSLASIGKRVLLVDADLRKPTVHRTFKLANTVGLSEAILHRETQYTKFVDYVHELDLFVLTTGSLPPNPSELLNSQNMKSLMQELTDYFDYVIYDAPPVTSVADAQILASQVDGVLLVVRQGYVQKNEVHKAVQLLRNVKANLIGYVMNDVPLEAEKNYYYGEK